MFERPMWKPRSIASVLTGLGLASAVATALAIAGVAASASASPARPEATPNSEIFSVNIANGRRRNLTRNQRPDVHAVLSPNGRTLVFRRQPHQLWAMRPDGSRKRLIANRSDMSNAPVAPSPDGRRIAFSAGSEFQGSGSVAVVTTTGRQLYRLSNAWYPTWSPDGARLAFLSDLSPEFRVGAESITVASADGSSRRTVIRDASGFRFKPVWAPRGSLVAVPRYINTGFVIDVLDVDTGATRRISEDGYHPAWSPDGRKLAFRGLLGVEVTALSDPRPRLVLRDGVARVLHPSWSPNGRWIACVTRRSLLVVRATGGRARVLARNVREGAGPPQWSTDSRTIFYDGIR